MRPNARCSNTSSTWGGSFIERLSRRVLCYLLRLVRYVQCFDPWCGLLWAISDARGSMLGPAFRETFEDFCFKSLIFLELGAFVHGSRDVSRDPNTRPYRLDGR
jgi:hypothetical protein